MDSSSWSGLKRQLEREFFAGGTAGSIGVFIGFPLDIIKVKLQVFPDQYKSAIHCFRSSIQEEGFLGLYKGCLPPILIQGVINSLMFAGESIATKILEPNLKPGDVGSPLNTCLAGAAGGVLQCIALVPSEVIKCNMQTQSISSSATGKPATSEFLRTWHHVRHIYRQEGFMGFYRGMGATMVREVPSIGLYFFSYKNSKDLLTRWQGLSEANTPAIMLAGGIAGALSWTCIYPCDVIKTTIQSSTSAVGAAADRGFIDTAKYLYQRHGSRIFFQGLGTTIVRAFPVNASTFYCYEKLKAMMHLEHVQEDAEFDGLLRYFEKGR